MMMMVFGVMMITMIWVHGWGDDDDDGGGWQ